MTMTLVSTVTVGSGGAASIDFTSIPQTGTDLLVVYSVRSAIAGAADDLSFKVNSSTTGYTWRWLQGTGSTVNSSTASDQRIGYVNGSTSTASTFTSGSTYIPNYSGSANKSYSTDLVSEANATAAYQEIVATTWANTSAITAISILGSSNLAQYSTASLYTIQKGSGGASVA